MEKILRPYPSITSTDKKQSPFPKLLHPKALSNKAVITITF